MVSIFVEHDPGDVERRGSAATEHEVGGRYRLAWDIWEQLRADYPERTDWNAPLVASYLGYSLSWTADASDPRRGDVQDALGALVRALAILAGDLARNSDDVTRWILVARALEQRCLLTAFCDGWTAAARSAFEAGEMRKLPPIVGDRRLVRSTAIAADAALDLLAEREDLSETRRTRLRNVRSRIAAIVSMLDAPRPRETPFRVVDGGLAEAERQPVTG